MNDLQIRRQIASSFNKLRSEAGLSQTALAKKIGCDQAKLSRIESGEIYTQQDIDRYLDGLETKNGKDFKDYLQFSWRNIDMPSFWNPQRIYLEETDRILEKAKNFLKKLEKASPLRKHVEKHIELLNGSAKYLTRTDHKVVFIGAIGVGKSTAISHLFNLLTNTEKENNSSHPILETGAGGTTICEVSIKDSTQYGISIIPNEDSEVKQIISDFCTILWTKQNDLENKNNEKITQSKELNRAVRNMARLTTQTEKINGKRVYHDPAEELLKKCSSREEFIAQVTSAVNISSRTDTNIFFTNLPILAPKEWLRDSFKKINNGQVPTMTIPKRITIMLPQFNKSFIDITPSIYDITAVDTKGLDDVSHRKDIDAQINDERAVLVFCSRFSDAPGATTKELLRHITDRGLSPKNGKASVLVLPRHEEALAMKRDDGEEVMDVEEGYDLKKDQILQSTTDSDIPVSFFDKATDNPKEITQFIYDQVSTFRNAIANQIFDLIAAIEDAIDNSEEDKYRDAVKEAVRRMLLFFEANNNLPKRKRKISEGPLACCDGAHASTLWASTRRNGNYSGLNIYHVIADTITKDANTRFDEWFNQFKGIQQTLERDNTLSPAQKFISQLGADMPNLRKSFLKEAEEYENVVYSPLLRDDKVWQACINEWGTGPGYKKRVLEHLQKWFNENRNLQNQIDTMLEKLWQEKVINNALAQLQKG